LFVKALLLLLSVLSVSAAETVWRIDNLAKIGTHDVTVVGAPRVTEAGGQKAVAFDGAKDGLFVPAIPFAGLRQFTIEVLFFPEKGGLAEQRFFHAQDGNEARALFETRLDGQGKWWLDTYIVTGATARGVTLVNRDQRHPTDRWYWVALRYDGRTMAHFVNGEKELEGPGAFVPFGAGQISIGVRQNKVFWFKGMIAEVRFHTEALPDEKLQRVR
jgi:hypothetical protein